MKKQTLTKTILSVLAVTAIPALVSAATYQHIVDYSIGTSGTESLYFQFDETTDNDTFKSTVKVSSMLADSGGDGSYCSFCQLDTEFKKKGLLRYNSIGSKTINTTTTGTYTGASNSKTAGEGTYRYYITNDNHYNSKGQITVTTSP